MLKLTLKQQPTVPLEADNISPDVTAGLTNDAIRALPVYLGKRTCRLDEFFDVEGEASDDLEIHGDARLGCKHEFQECVPENEVALRCQGN